MKYKIIVDSSSNLLKDDIKNENVLFSVVPLTIRISNKEYVDDSSLNVEEMVKAMNESSEKSSSSCPSPQMFANELEGADYYFVYTISQKLSGSYNSALVARNMAKDPEKILVLDSKLTAGTIELMVKKTISLIEEGKNFEEITNEMNLFVNNMKLLFVLNKFDNLVKNGRMSKAVAFIATLAKIKPLCYGEDGEIKIKEKIRTINGVFKRLVANIGNVCDDVSNRTLIISHTLDKENALSLKSLIESVYNFKEIIIRENRGLCAYYSLEGGIICCF